MFVAGLMAATLLGATLRARPEVRSASSRFRFHEDQSFQLTLGRLNAASAETIKLAGLQAAEAADTLAICRRLSLALVGSTLSLEEIRAIEQVETDRRVGWWVEYLLADPRWADNFSQRIARACVGTHEGPFLLFRRRKFNTWLSEQLANGTRYDQIVRQMIESEGLWTDTPRLIL